MNIFALHRCAKIAAAMHCDQHTKMLIEAAQMLYTHLHCLGVHLLPYVTEDGRALPPYKPFCPHHPVTLWLYGGRSHFFWLLDLALRLCERHTTRTGNVHKVEPRLRHLRDCVSARDLPDDCDVDEWLARREGARARALPGLARDRQRARGLCLRRRGHGRGLRARAVRRDRPDRKLRRVLCQEAQAVRHDVGQERRGARRAGGALGRTGRGVESHGSYFQHGHN